jgi:hypothetical protein
VNRFGLSISRAIAHHDLDLFADGNQEVHDALD